MSGVDFLLEGLEAELALERELGLRAVEIDRALLASPAPPAAPAASPASAPPASAVPRPAPVAPVRPAPPPVPPAVARGPRHDFVFLHDRALTAAAKGMMDKIVAAMGATAESAPVVFEGPRPAAKVYVVLGGNALKKWFPGVHGAPGQWVAADGAPQVLVTYSPHYLLRFAKPDEEPSPALQTMKRAMWTALKGVLRRVAV